MFKNILFMIILAPFVGIFGFKSNYSKHYIVLSLNESKTLLYVSVPNLEYKKILVRNIQKGIWSKDEKKYSYPISAVYQIFANIPDRYIKYSEDVYTIFKKQKLNYNWLKKVKIGEIEFAKDEFLMEHQVKAVEIAKKFDRFAYFLDTGTGKTIAALEIVKKKGGKWLVVVPKSIIRTGWYKDYIDFYSELKVLPISNNFTIDELIEINSLWGNPINLRIKSKIDRETIIKKLSKYSDVIIINPESFMKYLEVYNEIGVNGLIVDESTKIKNPVAVFTKNVTDVADKMKNVYIMTGNPDPNSKLDFYSQLRIIDPMIFGNSYYEFRNKYFESYGYHGYKWRFKNNMLDDFAIKVGRKSFTIKKEDCLDLPDRTDEVREIILNKYEKEKYNEMVYNWFIKLANNRITAKTYASVIMKLRQLTSGFIINTDTAEVQHIGMKSKLDELKNLLHDIGDNQVIIWINFREEARMISEVLGNKCVTANSETKSVDNSVEKFQSGEVQYIVANPATLKYGVTFTGNRMVKNCSYAIYFSLSYNYEDYYQSRDRIYRKGQTEKVTYFYLIASNTIDMFVYNKLKQKGKSSELFSEIVQYIDTKYHSELKE